MRRIPKAGTGLLFRGSLLLIQRTGREREFSKKEIREEKERILKKGGTFLIKGIWEYKGELILYGKVEEGFITDRTSFCLPRANGKTVRAYPESLQYNERDRVPSYIEWAAKGASVILRFNDPAFQTSCNGRI